MLADENNPGFKEVSKDKCQECKKDWTKCGKCPVMMKWVKEHKNERS